ncbi:MAG: helix-turn-helix domain-containing protein [Solirubrobacterales bacterium]|nr:helix-turn-helix domain-containing protein [Solirubrobacterales bacterium]
MRQKERSERNIRVVLMSMRQVPRKEVAEAFGITERQVRRIMSDWREGSVKKETELAVEAVDKALKEIRG